MFSVAAPLGAGVGGVVIGDRLSVTSGAAAPVLCCADTADWIACCSRREVGLSKRPGEAPVCGVCEVLGALAEVLSPWSLVLFWEFKVKGLKFKVGFVTERLDAGDCT